MICKRCRQRGFIKNCSECSKYLKTVSPALVGTKTQEFCRNPNTAPFFCLENPKTKDLVLSWEGNRGFGRIYMNADVIKRWF